MIRSFIIFSYFSNASYFYSDQIKRAVIDDTWHDMGMENAYKILVWEAEGREQVGNLDVSGRIVLRRMLKTQGVRFLTRELIAQSV
jgi:hypothetical protein